MEMPLQSQGGSSGHTFTTLVVEPTETINGFTLHECDCGYSYESDPVASLGAATAANEEGVSDTKVYDYVYNGSSLVHLTITTNTYGEGQTVETLYFGNGTVTYNNEVYYYVTNLQGDVIAILNSNGAAVVEYTYDAWGNILTTSGTMANTLGAANPLTYRGYVYDAESGLYYLQSRYYNANTGRFINADALVSTGQGLLGNNMFAYCRNKPVSRRDISGNDDEDCFDDETKEDLIYQPEGGSTGVQYGTSDGIPVGNSGSNGSGGNGGYTYSTPSGGGGVSTSVQVGNTTVTFGHGGRHMGGSDISQVESFIANDVVTRPATTGNASPVTIIYQGRPLYYSYFSRCSSVINVGTYYFERVTIEGE